MGRSRYPILEPDQPYFVTCTVLEWLPVFTGPETVGILLASLRFLQANAGLKVYAWVVLENQREVRRWVTMGTILGYPRGLSLA